jgi:arsenate reductase (glutaredoxin)
MAKARIYHNPNCSKSRQTLTLLEGRGVELDVVLYLEAPPSVDELDRILTALGREPLAVIRTKEALFKELGLSADDERPRAAWLRLMTENPILIERPIVVVGERARLGRPPEDVLELL